MTGYLNRKMRDGVVKNKKQIMKITIWSDFACPFCYLGETLLRQVVDESGRRLSLSGGDDAVEVEFRAYELDPKAPREPAVNMEEHFVTAHGVTDEQAREQIALITKMGSRAGLDYRLEGMKVCSTLDAHRLLKYAIAQGDTEQVLRLNYSLFKANFTDNLLLSDHDVLCRIAEDCGYDGGAVRELLSGDEYKEAVRADEAEADAFDLEFVPYMRFSDGTVLQGVLSKGKLRAVLR